MKVKITLTSKDIPVLSKIELRKEPFNEYDDEAIGVYTLDGKQDGYVASSYKIRKPGTMSAGRLVDKIEDIHSAVVVAENVAEVEVVL